MNARFSHAPEDAGSFSSDAGIQGWVATIGAGVTVMTKGNLVVTAQYQGAFSDGYTGQSGALKITWRF